MPCGKSDRSKIEIIVQTFLFVQIIELQIVVLIVYPRTGARPGIVRRISFPLSVR